MNELEKMCDDLVGLSFDIRGVDYGRIMRWVRVQKDGDTFYVFITSLGKKVEAVTLIDYIKNKVYYPDGTEYVLRQRKIKPKRNGSPAFPSGISTKVYFRGQTGNIKTNMKGKQ